MAKTLSKTDTPIIQEVKQQQLLFPKQSKPHKQVDPWKSSVAGVVANLASCVFHPLENVKIRFQANNLARNNPIPAYRGIIDALRRIYVEEGFFSLYRGVIVNMVAGSLANSIFFYVYAHGKKRYNYDPKHPYSLKTIMISLQAGLVSMFCTAPLWTVKTRMVLYREQHGLSNTEIVQKVVTDMWRTEGVKGFYHGFIPNIKNVLYVYIKSRYSYAKFKQITYLYNVEFVGQLLIMYQYRFRAYSCQHTESYRCSAMKISITQTIIILKISLIKEYITVYSIQRYNLYNKLNYSEHSFQNFDVFNYYLKLQLNTIEFIFNFYAASDRTASKSNKSFGFLSSQGAFLRALQVSPSCRQTQSECGYR